MFLSRFSRRQEPAGLSPVIFAYPPNLMCSDRALAIPYHRDRETHRFNSLGGFFKMLLAGHRHHHHFGILWTVSRAISTKPAIIPIFRLNLQIGFHVGQQPPHFIDGQLAIDDGRKHPNLVVYPDTIATAFDRSIFDCDTRKWANAFDCLCWYLGHHVVHHLVVSVPTITSYQNSRGCQVCFHHSVVHGLSSKSTTSLSLRHPVAADRDTARHQECASRPSNYAT